MIKLIVLLLAIGGPEKQTVTIVLGDGSSGSGVVFKNDQTCFVWTAAHVVEKCRVFDEKIDLITGQKKVVERFKACWVIEDEFQDGRKVGEHTYIASVIRFSDPEESDDVALLMVHKKNAFRTGTSFFSGVPKIGSDIFHVGSPGGVGGGARNALFKGSFSNAGRLRKAFADEELDNPTVFDQVSIPAQPGCSGGGIFLLNGDCVGLVSHGKGVGTDVCMIVPSRSIIAFAKQTKCLWAVDASVKLPKDPTEGPICINPLNPKKILPMPKIILEGVKK